MNVVKIIDLDQDDLDKVVFTSRFIADRQDWRTIPLQYVLESSYYTTGRMDMFWISSEISGVDLGDLCVEPDLRNPPTFEISRNHNVVRNGYDKLVNLASDWFIGSREFRTQNRLVKEIIERLYEPVGGIDKFFEMSNAASNMHMQHKIEVARKYSDLFKQKSRKDLDRLLRKENVYRRHTGLIAEFDHMVYIWKTYVLSQSKEIHTIA